MSMSAQLWLMLTARMRAMSAATSRMYGNPSRPLVARLSRLMTLFRLGAAVMPQ